MKTIYLFGVVLMAFTCESFAQSLKEFGQNETSLDQAENTTADNNDEAAMIIYNPNSPGTGYYNPYGYGTPNPYGYNPYGYNPYGNNPYGYNPYGNNPYGYNPYGNNPYGNNPYGYNPYGNNGYGNNNNAFNQFLRIIQDESFDSYRLKMANDYARKGRMTAEEIARVCQTFSFDSYRLEFAKTAYKNCVDKRNYFLLRSAFTFASYYNNLMDYVNAH